VSSARHLAVRVLDGLGLVEHHGVPRGRRQDLLVETQQGVGGEGELGVVLELAARAVVDAEPQSGTEASDLLPPAHEHARGAHHEGAAAHGAERLEGLAEPHVVGEERSELGLQGLAEPHVVGEERSELGLSVEGEPVDAAPLVGAQLRLQPRGQR
jgi:hypothetical protein